MRISAALSILILMAVGCASTVGDQLSDEEESHLDWLKNRTSEFTRFAHNPFKEDIAGPALMALTCGNLVARIGEPLNREAARVMSRSGYYDPMVILAYDGFSVGVTDHGLGFSRSVINYIEISDNTEPLKYGLKIGKTTRSDVAEIWTGVYTRETEHGFSYVGPAGESDDRFDLDHVSNLVVRFVFDESGVLERVKIQYQ